MSNVFPGSGGLLGDWPSFAVTRTEAYPTFPSVGKVGTTGVCATDFISPNRAVEAEGNIPRGID